MSIMDTVERPKIVELRRRADQAVHDQRRDDARRDLHEAIARGRFNHQVKELKQALALLGQIERDDGNLAEALACYEELISLHLANNNPLGVASALRFLADIHRENGAPELAAMCYQEAMVIYQARDDAPARDFALALRGCAQLKQEMGDPEAARTLWQAACNLFSALDDKRAMAECDKQLRALQSAMRLAG